MMYSHENFSRGKLLPKLYYLSNILTDQDSRILISRIRISRSLSAQKNTLQGRLEKKCELIRTQRKRRMRYVGSDFI